jgi:hypothetical protein
MYREAVKLTWGFQDLKVAFCMEVTLQTFTLERKQIRVPTPVLVRAMDGGQVKQRGNPPFKSKRILNRSTTAQLNGYIYRSCFLLSVEICKPNI